MKPAGVTLLYLVGFGMLAAQPAEPTPAKTSSRLTGEIRAGLPAFSPPPPQPAASPVEVQADPDVLVLPKFSVRERRIPTNDPDVWLTSRVIQHKAMAAYKGSMTPLEWALNSWFVPIFSAPASVRARGFYANNKWREEMDRMNHLIDVVEKIDPKQAAKMRLGLNPEYLPKDGDK